jgi:hypothetical protein
MAISDHDVVNIINKYTLPSFRISDSRLIPSLSCILYFDPNATIDNIVKTTRETPTGILSSRTIKLRDELLPYPTDKLVFELSIGSYSERCKYFTINVSILPLSKWLNHDSRNNHIYDLIKHDKQFYSKFNNNWIMIPFNMKIALSLTSDIKLLQRANMDLIAF